MRLENFSWDKCACFCDCTTYMNWKWIWVNQFLGGYGNQGRCICVVFFCEVMQKREDKSLFFNLKF